MLRLIECPRRKVNFQYCYDTGEHQFIEGQHEDMLSLPCPNNYETENILRKDTEAHRKECPVEMIQCEYHKVGCKRKLPRKDLVEHKKQKVEEHLMMTKNELADAKSELAVTNTQLSTAIKQINSLTVLINAHLSRRTTTADVWPVHLDTTATMFKLGNQVCPVTIKFEGYNDKKSIRTQWCALVAFQFQ